MAFKDNLLQKIRIDALAKKVVASIGSPDSGRRLDKQAMQELLEAAAYRHHHERDLDLYLHGDDERNPTILVLDNELGIYRTTIADVAMRKSPTVKEMVNIRNAIKILNDKDVKTNRKADSVETVKGQAIELLDLSFDEADLQEIEKDALASLKNAYADGVIESLVLFGEILDYVSPPAFLKIPHCRIMGASKNTAGVIEFGPIIIYSLIDNRLVLFEDEISAAQVDKIENISRMLKEGAPAEIEGEAVFHFLRKAAISKIGTTNWH